MINLNHDYYQENKNVRIRPLLRKDLESLRKWRNDKSNTTFLRTIPYITKEMQINWYDGYLLKNDELIFAIEEIDSFHKIVGSLSLYDIKEDECVFGKILIGDVEKRGQGIGRLAIEAAVDVAINQLGISRILLYVYKDNRIALNLYKKVGFEVLEEHPDIDGKIEYTMEYQNTDKISF